MLASAVGWRLPPGAAVDALNKHAPAKPPRYDRGALAALKQRNAVDLAVYAHAEKLWARAKRGA